MIIIYSLLITESRNPLIVDDLHPQYSCDELTEKSDVLYITPLLNNDSILNYPQWCAEMKSLNKTFGLHGIIHQYHELLEPIEEEDLKEVMTIFEDCFGYKPRLFRPPYNKISKENKVLVERLGMTVYSKTYLLHPYCHCQPYSWMKILNIIIGC